MQALHSRASVAQSRSGVGVSESTENKAHVAYTLVYWRKQGFGPRIPRNAPRQTLVKGHQIIGENEWKGVKMGGIGWEMGHFSKAQDVSKHVLSNSNGYLAFAWASGMGRQPNRCAVRALRSGRPSIQQR